MLLGAGQILLTCPGPCRGDRPHRLRLDEEGGREVLVLTCRGCSQSRRLRARHLRYSRGSTACGLAPQEAKRKLAPRGELERVTCPECQVMFVQELCVAPVPDWRPAYPIAEDWVG